jgi:hypothetical protein
VELVKTIAEQLLKAFQATAWSLAELLERTQLDCDVTSLGRKLHGKQKLWSAEADALATALGLAIACVPKRRARA